MPLCLLLLLISLAVPESARADFRDTWRGTISSIEERFPSGNPVPGPGDAPFEIGDDIVFDVYSTPGNPEVSELDFPIGADLTLGDYLAVGVPLIFPLPGEDFLASPVAPANAPVLPDVGAQLLGILVERNEFALVQPGDVADFAAIFEPFGPTPGFTAFVVRGQITLPEPSAAALLLAAFATLRLRRR